MGELGDQGQAGTISAQRVTRQCPTIREVCAANDAVYWVQQSPGAGTSQLMRHRDGTTGPISPDGQDVRSAYGGHGGGDFTASHGWVMYAASGGGVWCINPHGDLAPLVADGSPQMRYAGFALDVTRRAVFALREDARGAKPVRQVVRLPLPDGGTVASPRRGVGAGQMSGTGYAGPREATPPDIASAAHQRATDPGSVVAVLSGAAGYLDVAVSPGGARLAWVQIAAGSGAWGGTSLWAAHLTADGAVSEPREIAGGPGVSVQQPMWLSGDQLAFVTDEAGMGNVAVHEVGSGTTRVLTDGAVEYGHPRVTPGTSSYTRLRADLLVSTYSSNGFRKMRTVSLNTGAVQEVASPFVWVQRVASTRGRLVAAGTRVDGSAAVMQRTGPGRWDVLAQHGDLSDVAPVVSVPQSVTWAGPAGVVHGFYYAPSGESGWDTVEDVPVVHTDWHDLVWGDATRATTTGDPAAVQVTAPEANHCVHEAVRPDTNESGGNASVDVGGSTELPRDEPGADEHGAVRRGDGSQQAPGATIDAVATRDGQGYGANPSATEGSPHDHGNLTDTEYGDDDAAFTDTAPPLIVMAHAGPVGCAVPSASLERAYWTSRGFAVLEVNPSGTQGFGREYRDRLVGRWGELDVAEVALGARYMADLGWVDPDRIVVRARGREALTALGALAQHDVFAAAVVAGGVLSVDVLRRRGTLLDAEQVAVLVGHSPAPAGASVAVNATGDAGAASGGVVPAGMPGIGDEGQTLAFGKSVSTDTTRAGTADPGVNSTDPGTGVTGLAVDSVGGGELVGSGQDLGGVAAGPSWAPGDVTVPVLFLHGEMDQVTPLVDVKAVCAALRARGVAAELGVLEGAGHAVVAPELRRLALGAELGFYRRVLDLDAGSVPAAGAALAAAGA